MIWRSVNCSAENVLFYLLQLYALTVADSVTWTVNGYYVKDAIVSESSDYYHIIIKYGLL